jgi:membrane protein
MAHAERRTAELPRRTDVRRRDDRRGLTAVPRSDRTADSSVRDRTADSSVRSERPADSRRRADRSAIGPHESLWAMITHAFEAWNDDYAPSMGAALAYYTIFSLAPLLIVVIAIAGLIFGADAARGEIVGQIQGMVGQQGAEAIQTLLASANTPSRSLMASIIGIATLLLGATSVFGELQTSLDRIWRAPALDQPQGLWGLVRSRLLSFGMVVAMGFLLLVSLVVSAALSAVNGWGNTIFPAWGTLLQILNLAVSFGVTTLVFAMMYRILPRVHIAWGDVWIGALATAVLFTVGKYLIGLYIGRAGISSGFGAAGSLIVILVWVYYSAQIFLLGAEFTWVYAQRRQSGQRSRA